MGLRRVLDHAALQATRDLVATIRAITFLAALTLGAVALLSYAGKTMASEKKLGIIGAYGVIVIGFVTAGYLHHIRLKVSGRDYKILQIDSVLFIENRGGHRHFILEKKVRVRILRDGVRIIDNSAVFSGLGSTGLGKVESLWPDHQIFVASKREEDGRTWQWIYFGRALSRGAEVQFGYRRVSDDKIQESLPYWRQGPGPNGARAITAIARFPLSQDPPKVEGVIWKDRRVTGIDLTVDRVVNAAESTVDYVVSASNCRPGYTYGFRWTWPR
ncbi:hypothetical protein LUX33_13260 [Actinomadura madurae]|nr:hypothetical protein [Actinomadura madurae]MCP9949278.1 hypothetical protein [Actinomadura madurae]MCP9966032.1 hypothetical protein [Actinomadura madurae]